eukprot:CAMPEP_0204274944 /NCGR_PEP_ID=MMETSP0468-20130131/25474_1 /ASSEMBLY_ACC=CAM_ASM_000383 /TAXON_ID=2969 /ORGANISM="Oxyrrhis marina" /LENGTH=85 /DNA_ID=CAMNT_0051251217 /DNA_START=51 /DNA_END=305 /DNA_ORIENTATION=+
MAQEGGRQPLVELGDVFAGPFWPGDVPVLYDVAAADDHQSSDAPEFLQHDAPHCVWSRVLGHVDGIHHRGRAFFAAAEIVAHHGW